MCDKDMEKTAFYTESRLWLVFLSECATDQCPFSNLMDAVLKDLTCQTCLLKQCDRLYADLGHSLTEFSRVITMDSGGTTQTCPREGVLLG